MELDQLDVCRVRQRGGELQCQIGLAGAGRAVQDQLAPFSQQIASSCSHSLPTSSRSTVPASRSGSATSAMGTESAGAGTRLVKSESTSGATSVRSRTVALVRSLAWRASGILLKSMLLGCQVIGRRMVVRVSAGGANLGSPSIRPTW